MIFGLVHLLLDCCLVRLVLANHSLALSQRQHGPEDVQLVLEDFFTAAQIHGNPHRQQGHDLRHVVLEHVSDHPVLVVEGNATLRTKQRENTQLY